MAPGGEAQAPRDRGMLQNKGMPCVPGVPASCDWRRWLRGKLKGRICANRELTNLTESREKKLCVVLWLHYWSRFASPGKIASTPLFQPLVQKIAEKVAEPYSFGPLCGHATPFQLGYLVFPSASPYSPFHRAVCAPTSTLFLLHSFTRGCNFFSPGQHRHHALHLFYIYKGLLSSNSRYFIIIFHHSLTIDLSLFMSHSFHVPFLKNKTLLLAGKW